MFFYKSVVIASSLLFSVNAVAVLSNIEEDEFGSGNNHLENSEELYRNSDLSMDQCQQGDGPYFVTKTKVLSDEAVNACQMSGGELAPITSSNFNTVTSLLLQCEGSQTRGWVKSWNNIDYGSTCLALYTGTSAPGGGIDINCLGDSIRAVCIGPEKDSSTDSSSTNGFNSSGEEDIEPSSEEDSSSDSSGDNGNFSDQKDLLSPDGEDETTIVAESLIPQIHDAALVDFTISTSSIEESITPSILVRHSRKHKQRKHKKE